MKIGLTRPDRPGPTRLHSFVRGTLFFCSAFLVVPMPLQGDAMLSILKGRKLLLAFVFLVIASYRMVGPLTCAGLITLSYLFGATWYFNRVYPRRPESAFASLFCVGLLSTALISIHLVDATGFIAVFFVSAFTACGLLATGSRWRENRKQHSWPSNRIAALLVAVSISIPFSTLLQWPLLCAFLVSRPSLDRLADGVEKGTQLRSPEWAGLFFIWSSKTYQYTGDVLLVTGSGKFDECGFLRTNSHTSLSDTRDKHLNDHWTYYDLQLSERWQHQGDPKD